MEKRVFRPARNGWHNRRMEKVKLKVELHDSYIVIDRFIDVPRGTTLYGLHRIITAAFGWEEEISFFSHENLLESPDFQVHAIDMNERVENVLKAYGQAIFYHYNEDNIWPFTVTFLGHASADNAHGRAQLIGGLGTAEKDYYDEYHMWNDAIEALDHLTRLEVAQYWEDWEDFIDVSDVRDVEYWCDFVEPGDDLEAVLDSQICLVAEHFERLAHSVAAIDPFERAAHASVPAS